MKKIALLLAVVMVLTVGLIGCTPAKTESILTVCVGPDPDTIDPALNSAVDGATLIVHAFEGLYTLNDKNVPVPGQAKSVEISEDGKTYTFTLKDNLKWSDGTPLVASDFVYSWNRAADPKTGADYEYMFDVIKGYAECHDAIAEATKDLDPEADDYDDLYAEATKDINMNLAVTAKDDKTLVVELVTAVPYFLELTAFPAYSPVKKSVIEEKGEAWATKPESYIGNGAYKMVEWVSKSYIMYEKNEYYWDYENLGSEKIKFVLMDDDVAQLTAYNAGELMFIDSVPTDEIENLKAQDDFYIEGQIGTYYISFNVKDPALENPLFRKALILAVNRPWICVNIGKAGQVPAGAFVSIGLSDAAPGSSFRTEDNDYYDPNDYEGNLEEAKEIMAELFPDGNIPKLQYIYNVGTGHQLIAEALQSDWAKIGVEMEIESQEWSVFLNTRKNHEYQVARNGWLNDYNDPIGMLDMWVTGGGNNDAAWSNAQYDQLIKEIKSSSDPAERFAKMHQAEDILFEEWVLCPIYYYVDLFMLKDNVKGAWSSPLGFKYFMYATVE